MEFSVEFLIPFVCSPFPIQKIFFVWIWFLRSCMWVVSVWVCALGKSETAFGIQFFIFLILQIRLQFFFNLRFVYLEGVVLFCALGSFKITPPHNEHPAFHFTFPFSFAFFLLGFGCASFACVNQTLQDGKRFLLSLFFWNEKWGGIKAEVPTWERKLKRIVSNKLERGEREREGKMCGWERGILCLPVGCTCLRKNQGK